MRIIVKGGVWKNSEFYAGLTPTAVADPSIAEDEILKAAVMKYGKNQWARISSLLTRKTPKQCKARWFEWLDPSIKKTEWSKEEDEKLLHLAKLMPTQWRTIAPIVGRTPAQCLDRYQRLLDEAEDKEGDEDGGPNADDVRRLRPGEIDPEPESKPARPDPIDMDEDEKEMLSEARARLANTQGKKAKRKAREKQLEESRRLAALQKRRELKAAGIEVKARKKRKGVMDYNADVPLHKRVPLGFYDISEEKERESKEKNIGIGALLEKLEGKRRSEIEDEERKRDAKRQKLAKERGEKMPPPPPPAPKTEERTPRGRLNLPAPQVGDSEIEELMKIGSAAGAARAVLDESEGAASNALLTDYSANLRMATGTTTDDRMRTPRTASTNDTLRMQARNLRAAEQAQTPLLGENIAFEGDDALVYQPGVTPRGAAAPTPNPLTAHLTPRANDHSQTPRTGGMFGRTPVRDEIGINTPRGSSSFDETPRSTASQTLVRQQLSSIWKSLPAPKNDFEIVVADVPKPSDDDAVTSTVGAVDEDMAQVEARRRSARANEERIKNLLRSNAVQRNLPRPHFIFPGTFDIKVNPTSPEDLILAEVEKMVLHDLSANPVPGQPPAGPARKRPDSEAVTLAELEMAKSLIDEEVKKGPRPDVEKFGSFHDETISKYLFVPPEASSGAIPLPGRFELNARTNSEDRVTASTRQLEATREVMKREHARAQKMEKKLSLTLGGYLVRSINLKRELAEAYMAANDASLTLESCRALKAEEDIVATERVRALELEVQRLDTREREAQSKYRELSERRRALLGY